MVLIGKVNIKIDFQSTKSDVNYHSYKKIHACPKMFYLLLNILSQIGGYKRIINNSATPDISHQ